MAVSTELINRLTTVLPNELVYRLINEIGGVDSSPFTEGLLPLANAVDWRDGIEAQRLTRANILDYGAVDGEDANAAFTLAIASLPNGKGIVEIPEGEYHVDSLPIRDGLYYIGQGDGVSKLTLNSGATAEMFIADTDSDLRGGGVIGLELSGGATRSDYDCIELDAATIVNNFFVDQCYIYKFRRGYNGSKNATRGFERSSAITRTEFDDCELAIWAEEHPWVCMVWISDCDEGINGNMLDGMFCYVRFGNCGIGADSSLVNRTTWVCCEFYDNGIGLITGGKTTVTGCKFTHTTETYDDIIGILCIGNGNVIVGNQIGQNDGASMNDFANGGIQLIGDGTYATAGQTDNSVISGNFFMCGDGPAIFIPALADAGSSPRFISITGNVFDLKGQRALEVGTSNFIAAGKFDNNTLVHRSGTISSNGLVHWLSSATGGTMNNNTFYRLGGTAAVGVSGVVSGMAINGNHFTGFTTPISASLWSATLLGNVWGTTFTTSENATLYSTNQIDEQGARLTRWSTGGAILDFQEDSDNGSHRIRIKAPDSIASSKQLELPDIDGTLATQTVFPYISGIAMSMANDVATGSAMTADRIYWQPIYITESGTLATIQYRITTGGGTDTDLKFHVYKSTSTGRLGTAVFATSTEGDADATGVATVTCSATWTPGLYWFGFISSGTPTMFACNQAMWTPPTASHTRGNFSYTSHTYADAAPSSPAVTNGDNTRQTPFISVTISTP